MTLAWEKGKTSIKINDEVDTGRAGMLDPEPIALGDVFVIPDEILLILLMLAEELAAYDLFIISLQKVWCYSKLALPSDVPTNGQRQFWCRALVYTQASL